MVPSRCEPLTLDIPGSTPVSALWLCPDRAIASFVMAHGAGAGMRHAFLEGVAQQLAAKNVATLRYQFPYMEHASRRPDTPAVCHAAVRAAVTEAGRRSAVPLFAGGKSFGGRMTSQAQAENPLPGVKGLVFLGFPLHPAKQPSDKRAEHLVDVRIPLLFLQGTRDGLAEVNLLEPVVQRLGQRASLRWFDAADHSFHVPARSGRNDAQVMDELVAVLAGWLTGLAFE